jgi:hypothetical protein
MKTRERLAPGLPLVSVTLLVYLIGLCAATLPARADDWLPISQEELRMTAEPKAPGAPAIILYRQVDRDDAAYSERGYVRIKILTKEGLKQANIQIPFLKDYEDIRDITARTVRPDGSVVPFDGNVYEQPVLASRSANVWMKTFTMPAVEVGSIIEYRYLHRLRSFWVYDSRWILNADLFTKYAKFSLEPNRHLTVRWSWPLGLPEGTQPPRYEHGTIRLETHDVPAFVREDYMPPENTLRLRVDFAYLNNPYPDKDPAVFWKKFAKSRSAVMDRFLGWRGAMVKALSQIVQPGDSPEVKLRKIYARTQQIENLSYEPQRTEQEVDRENPRDIRQAEDVWSHGYGNYVQITLLFVGLARAAGIEADAVNVSTRNSYFFDRRLMNPGQLNATIVLARLDGKEVYLAPGVPFTPFGLLPWDETGVTGLVLDTDGEHWVATPFPASSVSTVVRKATLHLDETGAIQGKVVVTYTGLEALSRRLRERNEDGPARIQFLENDLKGAIPAGSDVTLTNEPDWRSSDPPLVAEFDLKVPGWVSSAGHYHLLTVGLFGAEEQLEFVSSERHYPVYFEYAFDHHDDVTVELPSGWRTSSTPQARQIDRGALLYSASVDNVTGALHMQRNLMQNTMLLTADQYDTLRDFFQTVRTGDEQQAVISPDTAAATH